MDLQALKDILFAHTLPEDFISSIKINKDEIENYFISLSESDIESDKKELNDICIQFIQSNIFKENNANDYFIAIITLFAELFEKIGFFGAISYIKAKLPSDSSIRYRLNAVYQYSRIGDLNEYIDKFDNILQSLVKAQSFSEVDYIGQVMQDTINYYLTGKKAFEEANQTTQLSKFKSLFNSVQSRQKYKFLSHPSICEYFDNPSTDNLVIELIADKVYTPSPITHEIFRNLIINPVNSANYLLDYNSDEIRADILNYGRADFSQPYKSLSAYDRVQLYCYFNMRKHFFTSYAVYEKIFASLNRSTFKKDKTFTMIDFGCGSLTSGLAIASLFHDHEKMPINLKYIGIDLAESMIQKAKEFTSTNLFSPISEFNFYSSWDLVPEVSINNIVNEDNTVLFNASYLFASSSLDEISLSAFVKRISSQLKSTSYFIFQNPDRADRNEKYITFKKQLSLNVIESKTQKVYYKTQVNSIYEPSSEIVHFEILSLNY